ncbi:hypothetical protein EJB05_45056, partial [Eragrostis curvula]
MLFSTNELTNDCEIKPSTSLWQDLRPLHHGKNSCIFLPSARLHMQTMSRCICALLMWADSYR